MNKWPASVKHFLWGTVFGVILVPLLYLVRLWMRHRSERVELNETDWP
jgi:hypothetical protein